jgi:RNA polymerase sigma factor (sigma-70 family)
MFERLIFRKSEIGLVPDGTNMETTPTANGARPMARTAMATPQEARTFRDQTEMATWPDERLLRQFLARSDWSAEAAFAVLIERHGPVVHRVCLDIVRDSDEAQDAAQAVFLVLARKAGSIQKPGSLGPWLHGVALRVARHVRGTTVRRMEAERRKAELIYRNRRQESGPEPMDHTDLHVEIDRLPQKYRQPIIQCYMIGQTQAQAAETLGWPLGTVQIRLHRGRERLRARLTRGGAGIVGLTSTELVKSLAAPSAAPGREWTATTARSAVRFAAGRGTAGLVTPMVLEVAERILATIFIGPLKVIASVAIILLIATASLSSTGTRADANRLARPDLGPTPGTADLARPDLSPRQIVVAPPVGAVLGAQPAAGRQRSAERLVPADDRVIAPRSSTSPGLALIGVRIDVPPNSGLELFERNWVKDDARGHGGDGLGPVFNGRSCVVCHNLGGTGGAGGIERNIEIATVTDQSMQNTGYFYRFNMDFGSGRFEYRMGTDPAATAGSGPRTDPRILASIHPGFRDSTSVVLHRYSIDPAYNTWRGSVAGQHGMILVRTSERNPPPLFGSGLIDSIPDAAIEAAAKRKFPGSATTKGRVSRLRDGRIGRFGWKAQTATLKEFVLSAAAGEMGLEVPDRRQAADPRLPGLGGTGLDMDEADCQALTDYVRALPAPVSLRPADKPESAQIKSGEELFKSIGCAHCHMAKLGNVEGIYSDLLLHDMSPQLEDAVGYTVFIGDPPRPAAAEAPGRTAAASVREWRTPPLWGLRDSAPYLHDGRAATIDQAIALHAGQGAASAKRHAELSPRRKASLAAFLKSLAAPPAKR